MKREVKTGGEGRRVGIQTKNRGEVEKKLQSRGPLLVLRQPKCLAFWVFQGASTIEVKTRDEFCSTPIGAGGGQGDKRGDGWRRAM